jgi:hypothetical protein
MAASKPAKRPAPKAKKAAGKSLPAPSKPTPVATLDESAIRRQIAILRTNLAAGKTDQEIVEAMDITAVELSNLKRRMYSQEVVNIADRPAEESFVDYRIQMYGVCSDLDAVSKEAMKVKQLNAASSALKAKAQIIDKVMERGQEMGVIPRAARKTELIGGVLVAALTDHELLDRINELSKNSARLLKDYGDKPMTKTASPTMYSGPSVIDAEEV